MVENRCLVLRGLILHQLFARKNTHEQLLNGQLKCCGMLVWCRMASHVVADRFNLENFENRCRITREQVLHRQGSLRIHIIDSTRRQQVLDISWTSTSEICRQQLHLWNEAIY